LMEKVAESGDSFSWNLRFIFCFSLSSFPLWQLWSRIIVCPVKVNIIVLSRIFLFITSM
jgi:hypothetical protein